MAATLDEVKAAFKKRYQQGAAEVSRRYPLARDHGMRPGPTSIGAGKGGAEPSAGIGVIWTVG